jgi:hypothetical protein
LHRLLVSSLSHSLRLESTHSLDFSAVRILRGCATVPHVPLKQCDMERLSPPAPSAASTADAGPSRKDVPHEHAPDGTAENRPPGDTALTELEFLDQLFLWAIKMRDHPEAFFTEAGLSEIDPPNEADHFTDPYGVRAQEDIELFP